ncbi:hypothetical protein NE235_36150 [Actinoallomurus spadix]|uniref:Zinc ribbon domain-containing protein n=1 Tax=Actinoallomurus spadix TaxID=79912 RepID=A0ABN0XUI9_9ACTN|nr:hypothetical protein [Actinoallomurus spadix]MCO5991562.1 hypothetical protein [Actinoallomurus spadix]
MDCPACGGEVPPGRSACPRCGTPLPPAGERPGPGTYSAAGTPADSPTAAPNPGTQPLPAVDTGGERPWNVPPGPHPVPGEGPSRPGPHLAPGDEGNPPEPGNATQILGPPTGDPMAPETPPANWIPGPPAAWSPGPPAGTPTPADSPAAGWNSGVAGTGPAPAGPPVGQPFGGPGPSGPPPGYPPYGWDQGVPPEIGGPPGQPPNAGGSGKNRKILLAGGIAAAVVVVGGLAYALTQGSSGGGGTPTAQQTTADTAAQQASAVEQVLKSGQTARGHLPARLRTCDDVSAGVAGFQQVVRDRQQELSRTKALKVDRLPNGTRLRQAMISAYQSSLEADQAYLAWAKKVRARGCGGRIAPLVAPYHDALSANDKAGPAKRRVAALWKPIATAHGLPAYAWNRL